ncbi:MAG: hypothetical protein KJ011_07645 [Burkholderiaceae bacterium]|nr:hypothetical protein [Burkholderiaceae bacterium]
MRHHPFRRHSLLVMGSFAAILIATLGARAWMDPLVGELTRLGGYLENDFGWRSPQEHFVSPQFTRARSLADYSRSFDVVVIGDSFSDDLSKGWQNYLAMQTGLSIISFNRNEIGLEDVLNAPGYRHSPPKLFVYQWVERNLVGGNLDCSDTPEALRSRPPVRTIPIRSMHTEITRVTIGQYPAAPEGGGMGVVYNYIGKSLARWFGRNITEVHAFRLPGERSFFSNRRGDTLLVLTRDFGLRSVSAESIARAKCSLAQLQARIEAAGDTAFVLLVFPDKTSAYVDYLGDDPNAKLSVVERFESEPGLNIAPLSHDFKTAIRAGAVDFYLPNDSHCGYLGYRIAAQSILRHLERRGLLSGPDG